MLIDLKKIKTPDLKLNKAFQLPQARRQARRPPVVDIHIQGKYSVLK
jgi:hypothetical protein